jgi:hypothetical protein
VGAYRSAYVAGRAGGLVRETRVRNGRTVAGNTALIDDRGDVLVHVSSVWRRQELAGAMHSGPWCLASLT